MKNNVWVPTLDRAIDAYNKAEGVLLDSLPVGNCITVQTQNTCYRIDKFGPDLYYISGHPKFCPEPTRVVINGSTLGGSSIKVGFLGVGLFMEFRVPDRDDKVYVTTRIQSIEVGDAPGSIQ